MSKSGHGQRTGSNRRATSAELKNDVEEIGARVRVFLAAAAENIKAFMHVKPQQTESEGKMISTIISDIETYTEQLEKIEAKYPSLDTKNNFDAALDLGCQTVEILESAQATITPLVAALSTNATNHAKA